MSSETRPFLFYFHLLPGHDIKTLDATIATNTAHDFPTVVMPVEIFFYISDTLQSICTFRGQFSRFPVEQVVIGCDGAARARIVFNAWKAIFSGGDSHVVLSFPDRKEEFCRAELLACMTQLDEFAHKAESGNYVIYCSDTPDYRNGFNTRKDLAPVHAVI